jgi:hypothetical protein
MLRIILITIALFACGTSVDGGSPAPVDAAGTTEGFCGKPGDPGNELGVGRYCTKQEECTGLQAGICSILGDPGAHFCTKACVASQADACGAAASCQCQGGLCGCVPTACL